VAGKRRASLAWATVRPAERIGGLGETDLSEAHDLGELHNDVASDRQLPLPQRHRDVFEHVLKGTRVR
jgi:hypothetical protein